MKLQYYESKNFGDALNPIIFDKFLPGFFKKGSEIDFLGIGSVLGLDFALTDRKKVVFSSGYAYGTPPSIDDKYDVFCVRGPLTAEKLGLDPELAICDGAILLQFFEFEPVEKKYDYAFMPHWESEKKYDWKSLCDSVGVHYISPMQDVHTTLTKIRQTKTVLAEAMHLAIVADALRVPWIPVKCYQGINEFKWLDWASTLSVPYAPHRIDSLFHKTPFTIELCREKISEKIPGTIYGLGIDVYSLVQKIVKEPKVRSAFNALKKVEPTLSKGTILKEKGELLLEKLDQIREKYG